MEEKKITEKESLELISRMIQTTKQNIVKGRGNDFLIYGYTALFLSIAIYTLLYLTHDPRWSFAWFLMFVPALVLWFRRNNFKPLITSYTDSMIARVWQVIGSLFFLTILVMLAFTFILGKCNFGIMLPLSLLYAAIGTAITGVIIKESAVIYGPFVGLVLAIYMLVLYTLGYGTESIWHLYFGLSFIVMMIIPGHILNYNFKTL